MKRKMNYRVAAATIGVAYTLVWFGVAVVGMNEATWTPFVGNLFANLTVWGFSFAIVIVALLYKRSILDAVKGAMKVYWAKLWGGENRADG